jgi:hypothetical protein
VFGCYDCNGWWGAEVSDLRGGIGIGFILFITNGVYK